MSTNHTQQLTEQDPFFNEISDDDPQMNKNNPNEFHAQPYDMDKIGFYFSDLDSYNAGVEASGAEEFEIQFIDGGDCEIFKACGIDQSNLEQWFDDIEPLDHDEKTALFFVLSCLGYKLDDALNIYGDASIQQDNLKDCASQFFDECYSQDIPENIRFYIDYDAFARDCEIGGDMTEFDYQGFTYTCTNSNGL